MCILNYNQIKMAIKSKNYYNKKKTNEKEIDSMSEKKKLSTREIVQQQLERKKQAQANNTNTMHGKGSAKKMQNQLAKKPSMTRRKMGS